MYYSTDIYKKTYNNESAGSDNAKYQRTVTILDTRGSDNVSILLISYIIFTYL